MIPLMMLTACQSDTANKITESASVTQRQDVMKNWKDSKDVILEVVADEKKPMQERLAKIKEHSRYLSDTSTTVWDNFGSSEERGDAKPTVWEDVYEWKGEIQTFQEAVKDFNDMVNAEEEPKQEQLAQKFTAVENSCKSCHAEFKM